MQTLSYGAGRDEEAAALVLQEPYRIGRPIGRGRLGWVCEASHARLPTRLAVKVLSRELAGDAEVVERFCQEAEILAQLHHPNMVQILEFNRTPDGLPYYVMEYLEGTSLAQRLEAGDPMLPARVVRIVDQVASVLAAAHTRGILHRDLTPASVFLMRIEGQNDEFVKVLDLGTRRSSAGRSVMPRYIAPEQALGQTERIDGRTDQFALAAITYAMLTGRDAFAGDDPAAVLYQVVHEQPPPLSRTLSWDVARVQAVVSRGLAKDQDMRYDSVLDFARALESAVFHATAVATAAAPAVAHDLQTPTTVPTGAPYAAEPEPPLRLPPAPGPAPKRAIATAKRRAVIMEGGDVDTTDIDPGPDPDRIARSRSYSAPEVTRDWDLPSTIDRIPISPFRAVALAGMAAVLAGVLFAKGWHREVPADLQYFRENAVAFFRPPAPLPQPEPEPPGAAAIAPAPRAQAPAPEPSPVQAPADHTANAQAANPKLPTPTTPTTPAPHRSTSRSTAHGSAERRPDTRRFTVDLNSRRAEPQPPAAPQPQAEPQPRAAPQPRAEPTTRGSSAGFSIAPPASQPVPDDILPLGANGEPASATGSDDGRPAQAPPSRTTR